MKTQHLLVLLCLAALFGGAPAKISRTEYDFVIVGAGTAGSVVAATIAKRLPNKNVLLIEAGGYDSELNVWDTRTALEFLNALPENEFMDWQQESTTQFQLFGRVLNLPRGKILGGSNANNILAHVWGNRQDWNDIAATMGDNGWNWNNLFSERLLTTLAMGTFPLSTTANGYSQLLNSCAANGFPENTNFGKYNSGNQFGCSSLQLLAREPDGPTDPVIRETTYDTFVRPLFGRFFNRVEVLANHLVTKLLFDGTTVTGVEVLSLNRNRTFTITATKEVIVSAGTYRTPHLLKLSGIGPAPELTALNIPTVVDLPGVGENLQDHMFVVNAFASFIVNDVITAATVPTVLGFGPETTGRPSCELFMSPTGAIASHLKPASRGTVKLASADPLVNPLVDNAFLTNPQDLPDLIACERHLLDIYTTMQSIGGIIDSVIPPLPLNATDFQIEQFIKFASNSWGHPVGSCKMGVDTDPMAVVDTNLKVYGTTNLRVIDASIFPDIPSGNTNSPTILVALKGAAEIVNDY